MNAGRVIRHVLLALCALGLVPGAHAGDKYGVKVVPYVEPQPPGPEETLIYVVREKTSFASAQRRAVPMRRR